MFNISSTRTTGEEYFASGIYLTEVESGISFNIAILSVLHAVKKSEEKKNIKIVKSRELVRNFNFFIEILVNLVLCKCKLVFVQTKKDYSPEHQIIIIK